MFTRGQCSFHYDSQLVVILFAYIQVNTKTPRLGIYLNTVCIGLMLLLQDYIFDKMLVTLVGYIQPVST